MKSLLLTPTYFPTPTGNAVTVRRISRGLSQGGIACGIMNLSTLPEKTLIERALTFAPDVIHNFHAWKSGRTGQKIKSMLGVPMITTVTGTDVNADLSDREKRDMILSIFAESDCVIVFNEQARSILLNNSVPAARIKVIHQSIFFPRQKKINYRNVLKIGSGISVFLLLGSIRKIKNPGHAIQTLEKVRREIPDLHLIIAGPVLERGEFRKLMKLIGEKKWITFLGEVSREHIRSLLRGADFLLNTSSSESEANAVMEAMNCRTIVIGKDIPGNASLLTDETALLFRSRSELYRKILSALANRDGLDEMRKKARQMVSAESFRFATERQQYLDIYREISVRTGKKAGITIGTPRKWPVRPRQI